MPADPYLSALSVARPELGCWRPGGQQAQTFGRRRAWLGGVDKHRQTRIGSYRELLVGQHQLAHYRTAKPLRPSPVGANVMGTPQAAEHIAAGGKLSTRSCIAR